MVEVVKRIILIARGYEWVCPKCEHYNTEIAVTEEVTCAGCKETYQVEDHYHAYAH